MAGLQDCQPDMLTAQPIKKLRKNIATDNIIIICNNYPFRYPGIIIYIDI